MQKSPYVLFICVIAAIVSPVSVWAYDGFDSHYPRSVRVQTAVTEDGYYLRAYLEGLRPEDVQIYVRSNRLVLEVVKGDQSRLQSSRARDFSRWKMRFRRQLRLPYDADWTHMTSSTRDGVMEIHIPRQRPYMPGDVDFSRQGFYSPYPLRN